MTSIRVPDTISKLSPDDTYPVVEGADVGGFSDLKKEVNTNTSKIEKAVDEVNALDKTGKLKLIQVSGDTPPDFGSEPQGNYVVTVRAMTKDMVMETPDPTGGMIDGAILTIFNDDPVDAIMLRAGDPKDSINGGQGQNIPPENFGTFVYELATRNFVELETGYIPAARVNMANYVEQKLTADGKLRSAQDIKDLVGYLSVWDDDGTKFSPVHTLAFKGMSGRELPDGTIEFTVPQNGGGGGGSSTTGIDIEVAGKRYPQITYLRFNDSTANLDTNDGSLYITPNASIGVEDIDNNEVYVGVDNVKFHHALVSQDPNENTEVVVKPYTSFVNQGGQSGSRGNKLTVVPPLKVYADPNTSLAAMLEIEHGTFEPVHTPGFLVYLEDDILVKTNDDIWEDENAHKAPIWLGEITVEGNQFVNPDAAGKKYEIQEADTLNPNVTGGTDYLIAFRAAMVGKAPEEGHVRAYIIDKSTDKPLLDTNGNPFVFHKAYDKGDELGHVQAIGVANFKGLREIELHVTTSFDLTKHNLTLGNKTNGGTCLLVQGMSRTSKTGDALQQFELDTKQHLIFDTHYFGDDFYNIRDILDHRLPFDYTMDAGDSQELPDGSFVGSIFGNTVRQTNGIFEIDGIPNKTNDFHWVRMFDAAETLILHEKDLKATVSIKNQAEGFNLDLVYWDGDPEDYTGQVYAGRDQMQELQLNAGWHIADTMYWDAKPMDDFHEVTKTFKVPKEAVNVGVMLRPAFEVSSDDFLVNNFQVDVVNPFIGYILKGVEKNIETHLIYSTDYKEYAREAVPGTVSSWIVIPSSDEGRALPLGKEVKGAADISLDTTAISQGSMVFNKEGKAAFEVDLNIWNYDAPTETVDVWLVRVDPDGTFTEIPHP